MDMKALEVLKSLNLLYVEDDAATREELAMMLEPWVGELHVAADGQEGLELFEAKRPDIVVTDIQMPRVNGLAMSSQIRRQMPEQPIVIISAYNDVDYLFRAIELGIDQYVTKPINVERLLDKLAKMTVVILALKERQRNQVLLEQYKHLVDRSAIVCKLDLAGRITYVNDKFCQISGYPFDDLIGRQIADLRHETEPKERLEDIFSDLQSGKQWSGIVRNSTCLGKMFVVESSLVPILNEHGAVSEIVSLDVEVTPLYETYEYLRAALGRHNVSQEKQRHFLSEYKRALEVGTCICVTDCERRIISVNRQFENLLGYSSDALTGKPLSVITPDASADRCLDEVQRVSPENFSRRLVRFLGHKGDELQFSVGCVVLNNLDGELDSIIMICQDLTETLRLSRDLVDTQRELLYMLGDALETRRQENGQCMRRVAQVAKFLALKAGLDAESADMIASATPMYDIGKVGIRDAILNKPGRLDAGEFDEMKEHARIGFNLIGKGDRPLIGLAALIAHQHHERYDGLGYPKGLRGEEICLEARIVGMAAVLDALFGERIYKPAWDETSILAYFREQRGQQFDPRLVDLLLAHWETIKMLRNSSTSSFLPTQG